MRIKKNAYSSLRRARLLRQALDGVVGSQPHVHRLPIALFFVVVVPAMTPFLAEDLVQEAIRYSSERGGTEHWTTLCPHTIHGVAGALDGRVRVDEHDPNAECGGSAHHALEQVPQFRTCVQSNLAEILAA